MPVQLRDSYAKLRETGLSALTEGARILEQDGSGVKVLALADGSFLKLFRWGRRFSSARLFPYARRFVRNAENLRARGFLTVDVLDEFQLPELARDGVVYRPLPGQSLRQRLIRDGGRVPAWLPALGALIASLHDAGVYFRGLHLGNLIATPERGLGLIDIADVRFQPWSLSWHQRARNFRHMLRYPEDRQRLGAEALHALAEAYVQASRHQVAAQTAIELLDLGGAEEFELEHRSL